MVPQLVAVSHPQKVNSATKKMLALALVSAVALAPAVQHSPLAFRPVAPARSPIPTAELRLDQKIAGTVAGGAVLGNLLFPFLIVLNKLGLYDPPPLNTFTYIANNAMDAARASGEVSKWLATKYSQDVWSDLLSQYYSEGSSTDFLTRAGGVCDLHAAWCDGVIIP